MNLVRVRPHPRHHCRWWPARRSRTSQTTSPVVLLSYVTVDCNYSDYDKDLVYSDYGVILFKRGNELSKPQNISWWCFVRRSARGWISPYDPYFCSPANDTYNLYEEQGILVYWVASINDIIFPCEQICPRIECKFPRIECESHPVTISSKSPCLSNLPVIHNISSDDYKNSIIWLWITLCNLNQTRFQAP